MAHPRHCDVLLGEWQSFARRDPQLELNQVISGDQLGDGMLHLQARVHLQEIEVALLIGEKLHRAQVVVAGGAGDLQRRFAHGRPHLRMPGDEGRRALFDDLLMPPLERAFALAQVHQVPVMIARDLNLDVTRPFDHLLDVDFAVLKGALRFAGCIPDGGFQVDSPP